MYFTHLPKINYNLYDNRLNETERLTNIIVRNKIRKDVLEKASLYYPYYVEENERPDIVSFNYYGDVKYTWIIFFANEIIDPFFQWPLNSREFEKFIKTKYGSIESAQTTIHHYEKIQRAQTKNHPEFAIEIDLSTYNSIQDVDIKRAVTNYDYEVNINESKRKINLIEDTYVDQIYEDVTRAYV